MHIGVKCQQIIFHWTTSRAVCLTVDSFTLFAYAEIWFMLILMLICCERKTLFVSWKSSSSEQGDFYTGIQCYKEVVNQLFLSSNSKTPISFWLWEVVNQWKCYSIFFTWCIKFVLSQTFLCLTIFFKKNVCSFTRCESCIMKVSLIVNLKT
jgi:hypothetical protein